MSIITRILFRKRQTTIATSLERKRLQGTMPGQTGAMLASRHGLFV